MQSGFNKASHRNSVINYFNLGFLNRYTQYFSFIIILFYGVGGIYLSKHTNTSYTSTLVIKKTSYIYAIANFPVYIVNSTLNLVAEILTAKHENKLLRIENHNLRQNLYNLNIKLSQYIHTSKILQFSDKNNLNIEFANIIHYSNNGNQFALLQNEGNKSFNHNLVICNGGLAGKILDTYDNIIKVILIENQSSYIPVYGISTGVRGILNGDGVNIYIKYPSTQPKVGEIIVTSGDSDVTRGNIPVGYVEGINGDEIKVKKICNLGLSNIAGIVL